MDTPSTPRSLFANALPAEPTHLQRARPELNPSNPSENPRPIRAWRVRVRSDDHPGTLARFAIRLADLECRVLGLTRHPVPGGVLDEFVLRPAVGLPQHLLIDAFRDEGGDCLGMTETTIPTSQLPPRPPQMSRRTPGNSWPRSPTPDPPTRRPPKPISGISPPHQQLRRPMPRQPLTGREPRYLPVTTVVRAQRQAERCVLRPNSVMALRRQLRSPLTGRCEWLSCANSVLLQLRRPPVESLQRLSPLRKTHLLIPQMSSLLTGEGRTPKALLRRPSRSLSRGSGASAMSETHPR